MADEQFDREVRMEYYRTSIQLVREIGLFAIKTMVGLNSGAFVVLLTYIGNSAAQSQFIVPIVDIRLSMFLFLAGLVAIAGSIAMTYIHAQSASPYPNEEESPSDFWFLVAMMSLPVLSLVMFILGVSNLIWGIEAAV